MAILTHAPSDGDTEPTSMPTLVFALLALVCFAARPAAAHEIRPAVVTAEFGGDNRVTLTVSTNIEALIAGVKPVHTDTDAAPEAQAYNSLRVLQPSDLKQRFEAMSARWLDGIRLEFEGARSALAIRDVAIPEVGNTGQARISKLVLTGTVPKDAGVVRFAYAAEFGSSVLRVVRKNGELFEAGWLQNGAMSDPVTLADGAAKSRTALFFDYIAVGFTHILPKGLDHILFVLGLYLLSPSLKPLLVQVTAFTVAHSITLALGLYGIVAVSPSVVEPLIALSIVYVAVENLTTQTLHPWRPLIVFCFGLLHGLGFAGVLHEIGLARADYVTGLVGFNIGVEFGQLAVIALAFAATGFWFRERPWYRARVVMPASGLIALAGLYWTVERTFWA